MTLSRIQECTLTVSEIIAPDVYYFYVTKDTRASLGAEAVVAIASFLLGAFCQGFIEYMRKKTKQFGEDAAKGIWESVRHRLRRDRGDERSHYESKLLAYITETHEIIAKSSENEVNEGLSRAQETLKLVLAHNNLPEEKATSLSQNIAKTIISEVLENDEN